MLSPADSRSLDRQGLELFSGRGKVRKPILPVLDWIVRADCGFRKPLQRLGIRSCSLVYRVRLWAPFSPFSRRLLPLQNGFDDFLICASATATCSWRASRVSPGNSNVDPVISFVQALILVSGEAFITFRARRHVPHPCWVKIARNFCRVPFPAAEGAFRAVAAAVGRLR